MALSLFISTVEEHYRELEAAEISLEEFTQQLARALNSSDFALQREVIRLLIERIVVKDEALVVEHIVPTTTRISKLRTRRRVVEPQRKSRETVCAICPYLRSAPSALKSFGSLH